MKRVHLPHAAAPAPTRGVCAVSWTLLLLCLCAVAQALWRVRGAGARWTWSARAPPPPPRPGPALSLYTVLYQCVGHTKTQTNERGTQTQKAERALCPCANGYFNLLVQLFTRHSVDRGHPHMSGWSENTLRPYSISPGGAREESDGRMGTCAIVSMRLSAHDIMASSRSS